ncbi:hypothetical protein THAOC_23321, partial [Thalassiosira oceanica]
PRRDIGLARVPGRHASAAHSAARDGVLRAHGKAAGKAEPWSPTRDNDELRLSLRSVERNIPWVRNERLHTVAPEGEVRRHGRADREAGGRAELQLARDLLPGVGVHRGSLGDIREFRRCTLTSN